MFQFTIGEHEYKAEKLNAFQQFHISRKIAPLIPPLIPVFLSIAKMEGKVKDNLQNIGALMEPFAEGLASLPDASAEYVIGTCLSAVKRRQSDAWMPIWSAPQKVMLFDDINDLGKMMPIVVQVIQANLGPFIQGLLTSLPETSEAVTGE